MSNSIWAESDGVRVEKSVSSDGAAEMLIEYQITSNRDEPVELRLRDRFPVQFSSASQSSGAGEWHLGAETGTFTHVLRPESTVRTVLRSKLLSTKPLEVDVDSPTLDVKAASSDVDTDDTTPTTESEALCRGARASISTFHGPNDGVVRPESPSFEFGNAVAESAPEPTETPTGTAGIKHPSRAKMLESLHRVAIDLATLETAAAICERTVAASEEILQFDLSTIDLEEDGYLSKVALSSAIDPANTTTMPIDEGISGKTYREGDSYLIANVNEHPAANPQGPYRSALSIPIGTHGVFQAVSEQPDSFDETDLKLAELLIRHTESALDRITRERRLRTQNERLEAVTRIISHDLRNPLNVLGASLEALDGDCDPEQLQTALDALSRIDSIVTDTLTMARNDSAELDQEAHRLDTIVSQCWDTVETNAADLEIQSERVIRADRGHVRHLFENLFRNTVEHAGSAVTVRVGDSEGGFYVEDDGQGIPESEQDDIFALDYSTTGGSGFGLAIVKQIAEAHGWTVRVSEGSNGGARFEFGGVEPTEQ